MTFFNPIAEFMTIANRRLRDRRHNVTAEPMSIDISYHMGDIRGRKKREDRCGNQNPFITDTDAHSNLWTQCNSSEDHS